MIKQIEKSKLDKFMHNVTWLRKQSGLSKAKMADLLGISVASLNKIEHGVMPPRLSTTVLFEIRNNFGIYPEHILEYCLDEEFGTLLQ